MAQKKKNPQKEKEEARKKGGWELYDESGNVAIVPDKVMRCPKCGGIPVKKDATRWYDRMSVDRTQIFKCHDCGIDFSQVKKQSFCEKFNRNVTGMDCNTCPVGIPFKKELLRKYQKGEDISDTPACPFWKGRLGMDWVPEEWDRDVKVM